MSGPLNGTRVLELGGIGPVPFATMMLADMGAEVLRVSRPEEDLEYASRDMLNRNKVCIRLDLKDSDSVALVKSFSKNVEIVVEGFRPGTAERLGLGPGDLLEEKPSLVYGRLSGWGRTGALASTAGHDINYISLAGALHGIGAKGGPPVPPLAYIGDFGGAGMSFATGLLAALLHARSTGEGQVVDSSILAGAALLTLPTRNFLEHGEWKETRGSNLLDGGAPFYGVYETADGEFVSIGPLEPKFYAQLLRLLHLEAEELSAQYDSAGWEKNRAIFERVFRSKTRDEWCELLEGTDVCFAPVLSMREAEMHPHNVAEGIFVEVEGRMQPAPTPKFYGTGVAHPSEMTDISHNPEQLRRWLSAATESEHG